MSSIEDILRSGMLADTKPGLSAAWGTTAAASSGSTVSVMIDGATSAVTLPTLAVVGSGARVFTLLAGGSRVVIGALGGSGSSPLSGG